MRYLMMHTAAEWSGTARAFVAAARGLGRRGHEVTVVVEPDSIVERVTSQESIFAGGVRLFDVVALSSRGGWMRIVPRLRALARRLNESVTGASTPASQALPDHP